ncbi:MAG: hypothetical protein C4341_08270 [Armatimonadota bacterium]
MTRGETNLQDAPLPGYRAVRENVGVLDCPEDLVLSLKGEDRRTWLHGQVTNDVLGVHQGGSTALSVLKPTGQIVANGRLWNAPESLVLVFPHTPPHPLLERLEMMIILEDVRVDNLSGEHDIVSVQGPKATEALSEALSLPMLDWGEAQVGDTDIVLLRHDRTGEGGWDLLFPRSARVEIEALLAHLPLVTEQEANLLRLEAGIPMRGRDYGEKTLAMEMGQPFIEERLNFHKGCYTGQEVVERIRSRGHTNRTWVGLRCEGLVEAGAQLKLAEDTADALAGDDVGQVTSAALSPLFGPIAAAMVRNVAARPGTPLLAGETLCMVQSLPFLK